MVVLAIALLIAKSCTFLLPNTIRVLALTKGYLLEINLDLDDDIYHLYINGTVEGNTSLLEELFTKIIETDG